MHIFFDYFFAKEIWNIFKIDMLKDGKNKRGKKIRYYYREVSWL